MCESTDAALPWPFPAEGKDLLDFSLCEQLVCLADAATEIVRGRAYTQSMGDLASDYSRYFWHLLC
jgi:hypothetical protein